MGRILGIIALVALIAASVFLVPWGQRKLAERRLQSECETLAEAIVAHPFHLARQAQDDDPQRHRVRALIGNLEQLYKEMPRQPGYDASMERYRSWNDEALRAIEPWCDRVRAEIRSLPQPLKPALAISPSHASTTPIKLRNVLVSQARRAASEGRHDDAAAICSGILLLSRHFEANSMSMVVMMVANTMEREVFDFLSTLARDDPDGFRPEPYTRALRGFIEREVDVQDRILALQRVEAAGVTTMFLTGTENDDMGFAGWPNSPDTEILDDLAERIRGQFAPVFEEPPPPIAELKTFEHLPVMVKGMRERRALRLLLRSALSLGMDAEAQEAGVIIGLTEKGPRYSHPDAKGVWPADPATESKAKASESGR